MLVDSPDSEGALRKGAGEAPVTCRHDPDAMKAGPNAPQTIFKSFKNILFMYNRIYFLKKITKSH